LDIKFQALGLSKE
jgi:ATP-binding cassette, subfamily C (CFTR/MRP), member 1